MAKNKAKKAQAKLEVNSRAKVGFFKRFAFVFESFLIILITAGLVWLTRFVDVSMFVQNFAEQYSLPLAEVITKTAIISFALIILITRYSAHLRRKIKRQFIEEEDIKKLAFFDRVTNLPNQALCENRLEHAVARASRNSTSIAVLFIGVSEFKAVNDKHGHEGGDKLLQQLAKRLSAELRSGDTLARVTGVEFIVILESQTPNENISVFAESLLNKLVKCYRIAMQEVYISGNIGIATYPNDGEHCKELIKNADTAMCFAKEQGRNSLAFFSKELQEKVDTKKKVSQQLLTALEKQEFELHYQPVVTTRNGNVVGVEALLRWHNELLGNITPDVFIPIAESMGLITKIGDWVLTQACKQNKAWQEQGYLNLIVSVNLSAMQLSIADYGKTIAAALADSQLEPQYLALEFSEKSLMVDAKSAIAQLRQLKALGVLLTLDDFGTGYSSIKYLPKLRLSYLKVDNSFIRNVPHSAADVTTSEVIVAIAKQLSLQVTAVGVETTEQNEFVESLAVDTVQGYYYSKPVDAKALAQLLESPPWQQDLQ